MAKNISITEIERIECRIVFQRGCPNHELLYDCGLNMPEVRGEFLHIKLGKWQFNHHVSSIFSWEVSMIEKEGGMTDEI